jgi:hypothetical protein
MEEITLRQKYRTPEICTLFDGALKQPELPSKFGYRRIVLWAPPAGRLFALALKGVEHHDA